MFEEKTFENILSDLLEYVSDRYPDLDTREGSIIYTSLAPIALELETAYHEMEMILEETFFETASKEYLIKHGDQMGVPLNEATCGHFEGEFDVDLEIGSRFNLDKFNYNVIGKLSDPTTERPYYIFELVCETEGTEPNDYLGDLTPITFIDGDLSHAKLTSVIIYGEDEEETEEYRYRLQIHTKNPPIDGNVAQYNEWLDDYDGVGKYTVTPCWNGVNTVKLTILDSDNNVVDTSISGNLVNKVQTYFDPPTETINDDVTAANYPQGRGMGNGQAPIGAIVTVNTATEVPVIVACGVKSKNKQISFEKIMDTIDNYLKSIALEKTTIGYMPISAEIYKLDDVEEITTLSITVNGTTMDTNVTPFIDSVTINKDEIAVLNKDASYGGVE